MPNNTISSKIFLISFNKYLSIYSSISDSDLDKIATLDIISSFDYEKEEFYYCYIICNDVEIKKYKKILDENYINYSCEDLSEGILKNEYNIYYIKEYIDNDNYYLYEDFIECIEEWIFENLDLDIVLDLISLNGMNNLREVDRKFLKENYEN